MNKKSIIISLIVLTVILIIGSSYAYLKAERESGEQSLSIKNFGVILLKDMVQVTLDKTVPMSDEDGIYNESTTFEIQNTGEVSANYKVSLVDKETKSTMSNNDIRYRLTKISSIDNTKETFEIRNLDSNGIIDEGVIEVSEIITYEIVLWIDIDANPLGQTFNKVVEVDATQNNSLDRSGANPPEMLASMIPVYYEKQTDESGVWKIADITNRNKHYAWYNYGDYKKSSLADVKTMAATILPSGDLSLDGASNYAELGYEKYDFKNNISLVARVKVNSFPSDAGYIIGNAEGAGFYLTVKSNKSSAFGLYINGNYVYISTSSVINLNTWYTVVATYDNSKMKLYVYQNGSLLGENETSVTGVIKPSPKPLTLGANPNNVNEHAEYLNGIISDVLVYTDTLTDTEIKTYFTGDIIYYPKDNLLVEKIGFLESESNRWANAVTVKEANGTLDEENNIAFDGTLDNYYNLGYDDYDFKTAISLVVRIKILNEKNDLQALIGNWESGGGGMEYRKDKKFQFAQFIDSKNEYIIAISPNTYDIGEWHTLVGTYDHEYLKFYIDGVEVARSSNVVGNIKKTKAEIILGGNPGVVVDGVSKPTGASSNVTVSDTFVYTDALTSDEVEKYFKGEITDYPKDNLLIAKTEFNEVDTRQKYLEASAGTEIKTEDIASNWVWIPRFKYNTINESVNFSNGIKKEETTLQAFTNENKELVGFYVSKEDINNLEEVKQNIIDNNKKYEVHTINDNEKTAANYLLNSKYGNKSQLGNALTNNRAVIDIYHEFPWLNE